MNATIYSENIEAIMEISTKVREILPKETVISAITSTYKNNIGNYGVNKLYLVGKLGSVEEVINIVLEVVKENNSKLILFESNKNNREVAARIAAKMNAGYIADCIDFNIDVDGKIVAKRMVYASKAIETIKVLSELIIMTIPRKIVEPKASWNIQCEVKHKEVKPAEVEKVVIDVKKKELSAVPLESAEVIVSIGRGVKRKEDCKIIEELASILGGVVSCSRPIAADLKWFNEWIGLSGYKVSPKLYIAIGISGAIQHLAGIQNSKVIVAINKDLEAPIIKSADYGVVVDLYEFIPKLIEKLKTK
ncbi:MAG: electron transfer flavoprotein subunit alpha/FixB family protein [Candidatus Methanomethylicia archaeon]|nr:electron transfer flavoprotein subunit alpha/FixB family protein [Candidatus Methanomethylicia archaeon]